MLYPTFWRASGPGVLDEMLTMRRELERYFGGAGQQSLSAWNPAVEVRETTDNFQVYAELPGLTDADVNVTVQGGVLTISGEKKEEMPEANDDVNVHLYERRYGRFERSFTLPRTVIADDVRAHFANGVLTVTLPKAAEAKPRRIQIHAGEGADRIETGRRN